MTSPVMYLFYIVSWCSSVWLFLKTIVVKKKFTTIEIFLGHPGTLCYEIARSVLSRCDDIDYIHVIPFCDTDDASPKIWINDENEGTAGLFTVCRCLGQFSGLTPVDVTEALANEASMERLSEFTLQLRDTRATDSDSELRAVVLRFLHDMNEGIKRNDVRSPEREDRRLCDVCWQATLLWLQSESLLPENDLVLDDYSHVAAWLTPPSEETTAESQKLL